MFENKSGIEVRSPDDREFVSNVAKFIQAEVSKCASDPHVRRAYGRFVVVLDHTTGIARQEASGYGLKTAGHHEFRLGSLQLVISENEVVGETVFAAAAARSNPIGGFRKCDANKLLVAPLFLYIQRNIATVYGTDKVVTLLNEVSYLQEHYLDGLVKFHKCIQMLINRPESLHAMACK